MKGCKRLYREGGEDVAGRGSRGEGGKATQTRHHNGQAVRRVGRVKETVEWEEEGRKAGTRKAKGRRQEEHPSQTIHHPEFDIWTNKRIMRSVSAPCTR